jgi:hypothetical protein
LRRLTVEEADDIATSLVSQYPISEGNIDPQHIADFDIAIRVIHALRMEMRTLRNRAAAQAAVQAAAQVSAQASAQASAQVSANVAKDKRHYLKIVK